MENPYSYDGLGVLARQSCEVTSGLEHVELYTMSGLLTVLWHGNPTSSRALVLGGGAAGGLLGPADGLYHRLGVELAADGWQVIRVGYRRPNHVDPCVHDLVASAELAWRGGARRFVFGGHSFGGAVAIGAAVVLGERAGGVVTFATQSAGCETAGLLEPSTRLLLIHGDRDELLPVEASMTVRAIAGRGELEVLEGAGHVFSGLSDVLMAKIRPWLEEVADSTLE